MRNLSLVLLISILSLGCAVRAIAPGNRIAKSSQDFNIQIEEAQNRNLLTNIWRAKKRYPLYLTDTSKVTGSLTNSYVFGLMIPLNKPETGSASPSATFTQNPTFDVNVLSSQEFMRGFLTPVSPATFAYYLRQGWPPELLIHLLVRDITIVDSPEVDEHGKITAGPYYFNLNGKKVARIRNYPDPAKVDQDELMEFSTWARYLANFHLATCQNNLLKGLSASDFSALDSATKALAAGLNIVPADARKNGSRGVAPSKTTSKVTKTFAGTSTSPSSTATEDSKEFSNEDESGQLYNAVVPFDILIDNPNDPVTKAILRDCAVAPGKLTVSFKFEIKPSDAAQDKGLESPPLTPQEMQQRKNDYMVDQLTLGSKASRVDSGISRPEDKEASIQALLSVVERDDDGKVTISSPRTVIIKLSLRSPEAVLYYLGELARLEEYHGFTQRACINGFMQPIFAAYSEKTGPARCKGHVNIKDSEGDEVYIPPSCDPNNERDPSCRRDKCTEEVSAPVEQILGRVLSFNENPSTKIAPFPNELQCNGGRSMHSLNLLSQLIALQKSAKDFPTTPTVRVIGQ